METKNLLIIFTENPEIGKVKPRLAKSIGDKRALETYVWLLTHTYKVTFNIDCEKAVFYANNVQENDLWEQAGYEQHLQKGNDLGERMMNALRMAFKRRYHKVIIIGTDCFEISNSVIEEAFNSLDENNTVLGPSTDGGYYLIGMKTTHSQLFNNKEWKAENVLLDTLIDLKKLNLSVKLLKTLTIIEEEKDLEEMLKAGIVPGS